MGAMDKAQPDMVLEDGNLANAGADKSPSPLVKVAQPAPADDLHRVRSDFGDDVPQLEDEILTGAGVCWRKISIS